MCETNKSLQEFTESIDLLELFKKKKWTHKDIEGFNTLEKRELLNAELTRRWKTLENEELERFCEQIEDIITVESKNKLWESNHIAITQFINQYVNEYGQFPQKMKISEGTKLSRVTIDKHLNEYYNSSIYKEYQKVIQVMREKVIAKVYQLTQRGDLKACRLFLDVTGGLSSNVTITNKYNQNNYIQINNTIVNDEVVRKLTVEELDEIEAILKKVI